MRETLLKRFISYVTIDTQSDENSPTTPSTKKQWDLLNVLHDELKAIGMSEVSVDASGYLMATLDANTTRKVPTIGFLAHVDTATDMTGKDVQPQMIENYDGTDIVLNSQKNIILKPSEYPNLKHYHGHTLITTDGTTLLGADNKAGIAEIMTAMAYLIAHPEIKHGKIRVAFTPDEEIGRGPHHFDVERFGCDYAYTVDGGPVGELQYESFNAAHSKITIHGNNVHPGTAKNKLVHATKLAMAFHDRLPKDEAPEFTDKHQGFYHLLDFHGDVETATLDYIIRDHNKERFLDRKKLMANTVREFKQKYGDHRIEIESTDQYYNMKDKIEPVFHIVEIAEAAMKRQGITPIIEPIRGGTDGAQLSYMGLPTPNLFTGGENFHGKFEFASLDDMEKSVQTICLMCQMYAEAADRV